MRARLVKTEGIAQQVLEEGEGPLVLLCHGFPETAFSWRRQLPALADAGFWAVAPDMRGYGGTERPAEVEAYGILELVGDMVDLVHALGRKSAAIVGHDWGAHVAWHAALLRPDVFTSVAAFSVPFRPRSPSGPPIAHWRAMSERFGRGDFYIVRFQEAGAEAELEAEPQRALLKMICAYDGGTPAEARSDGFVPRNIGFLEALAEPAGRPAWLSAAAFGVWARAFEESGFTGPLNWYRNIDRNWALTAFTQGRRIERPALFLTGEHDPVRRYSAAAEAELVQWAPRLREIVVVPGAGHWIQQERPDEVNTVLVRFLKKRLRRARRVAPGG
jgi:pimeloyl-ACP methyl ester carboxylesterase